ncbi:hypothetical protein [Thalassorhabdomicrobium marinisediminis]|uniref:Lipoprotein n=1 Tax=Thalassorhabdomicrobium marinisediminis TaxID=2170577 RepID=A0A2T7G0X7_9RHOB|nr:hypothetical protein [Thalassorhabdomicrobium marinisediminis]PVA08083.1 hypothetical protein DC363_00860 [Thalassorhabdomicrobium marinisediminis]
MRLLALPLLLLLAACSGKAVTEFMPGEAVVVNGYPYTVNRTAQGVTVQNFETGRTSPAVLLANAGLAAEQVTGCTVETIVKDGLANTYYATLDCEG